MIGFIKSILKLKMATNINITGQFFTKSEDNTQATLSLKTSMKDLNHLFEASNDRVYPYISTILNLVSYAKSTKVVFAFDSRIIQSNYFFTLFHLKMQLDMF